MTLPLRIRSQCDKAAVEYEKHLRDILRDCSPEELASIPELVAGDVDRLFELHDVAARIAARQVKEGC